MRVHMLRFVSVFVGLVLLANLFYAATPCLGSLDVITTLKGVLMCVASIAVALSFGPFGTMGDHVILIGIVMIVCLLWARPWRIR